MKYRPKLDPKMFGNRTPEEVVRRLFRNRLLPRHPVKPVPGDEVTVEKVPADEAGDGVPHLDKRS